MPSIVLRIVRWSSSACERSSSSCESCRSCFSRSRSCSATWDSARSSSYLSWLTILRSNNCVLRSSRAFASPRRSAWASIRAVLSARNRLSRTVAASTDDSRTAIGCPRVTTSPRLTSTWSRTPVIGLPSLSTSEGSMTQSNEGSAKALPASAGRAIEEIARILQMRFMGYSELPENAKAWSRISSLRSRLSRIRACSRSALRWA